MSYGLDKAAWTVLTEYTAGTHKLHIKDEYYIIILRLGEDSLTMLSPDTLMEKKVSR